MSSEPADLTVEHSWTQFPLKSLSLFKTSQAESLRYLTIYKQAETKTKKQEIKNADSKMVIP